ncbi:SMP-30/gluconolactonase/LRE family protein [Nocardia sp. NBC_01377]|uniref:SMP-30/gluconolactonase/LRE family protein n=1 Tax=Nocardia sp. NBC_01377 TaxID=2903595 RepID=UPI0032453686
MTAPRIEVAVTASAVLGEGPTWDHTTGRLIWVDILGSHVHTYTPASGATTTFTTSQHVGAAKPRAGGGLVVNLRDGIGVHRPDGGFDWLHHQPVTGRRGNDAAVAPDGALWAGTMRYDEAPGGGTLVRLAADHTVTTCLDDVAVSNGIGWSPDGTRMYYVDSPTRRVDVFDFADGHARDRRPWVRIPEGSGWPDGLTVDATGAVWVALWDGAALQRYTPDGTLDRVVELPMARPTACAFGGDDLTDLYVTTAQRTGREPHRFDGSLLVLPDIGTGLAQPLFTG